MITHVGLVRDHSASMRPLINGAMQDYNVLLDNFKAQDSTYSEVYTSAVKCGTNWRGEVEVPYNETNLRAKNAPKLLSYEANGGGTPLWDSVMRVIDVLEKNENDRLRKSNPLVEEGVAFLVMVITDGQENRSVTRASVLADRIRKLNATDRWTFVFRVPKGHKHYITSIGIPEGNVMEWEQTSQDLQRSSVATVSATTNYFNQRSRGLTSSQSFYTDLSSVSITDVKKELTDITKDIRSEPIWNEDNDIQIRDFCQNHFGGYLVGKAYYELSKPEKIQGHKNIIIKHKKSGKYYGGSEARNLLGLPSYEVKVVPGNHHQYEIYIQSTSVNRKLKAKTKVLYLK